MLSREQLQQIADDELTAISISYTTAQEMALALLALQWRLITETDLPKVGDEVLSLEHGAAGVIFKMRAVVVNWELSQCRIAGWTHFRPIAPPTDKGERP